MYVSNKRVWKSAQAVARYQQQLHQGLTPAEKRCISKTAANGTTLDIGVGTGRTTAVIGRKFKTYIGIDYSSEMINEAQRNFPDMDLRVMDARNLQFPRNSFDTILFPFNGIDCVDYDGRRKIISEVRRIIKPGGLFYYSTHNAGYFRVQAWQRSLLIDGLWKPHRWPCLPNRLRNFWRQNRYPEGYALVNDGALNFSLLLLYVSIDRELVWLQEQDFQIELVIGSEKTMPGYDESDCWVHILARQNC